MEYDETVYACAVNRIFNYNCREARILTDMFPSPGGIFSLSRAELSRLIHRQDLIDALSDREQLRKAYEEVEWARAHGIHIIYIGDSCYPPRLKECPDAPVVLFFKGSGTGCLSPARAVAVVGTRNATSYGLRTCREIIRELSRLWPRPVIISGLAYGIDICAHLTALECGMETVAVLPTGMDSIYPRAHREYAIRITGGGGLVTDFPKGSAPQAVTFLRRNRIIAGLADAVLLIESAAKGGGLITASLAQSYSREVMAVPGRLTDMYSAGCNALIARNAAAIIQSADAPAKIMGWDYPDRQSHKARLQKIFEDCGYIKRNILLALAAESVVGRDTLIEKAGGDPSEVLPAVTELELDGVIESDLYGNYSLKNL